MIQYYRYTVDRARVCVCALCGSYSDDDMDAFWSSRAHLKGLCSYTECGHKVNYTHRKNIRKEKEKKNPAEAVFVVHVYVYVCLSTQKSS